MSDRVTYPGMPLPARVQGSAGVGAGAGPARLVWQGTNDPRIAARFGQLLGDSGCGPVRVSVQKVCDGVPHLDMDESYELVVDSRGIRLNAAQTWGALAGLGSLAQLHQSGMLADHIWEIADRPRFPWRGLLIDCARHFIPVSTLMQVLEGMAWLKLNVLHLHLTDDQAFRVHSKAFPKLASGPAYGAEDVAAIVERAGALGIRVVPEIDMPGHVTSWLVSYPEWGLHEVGATRRFGVHEGCLNAADESVYAALRTLLREVADLFPDEYLHLGGDEVHPGWGKNSRSVQQFIATNDLEDERGLQAWFNRRISGEIEALGKRPVGWDEVLHPDMPAMLVQNWRGATTRDRALANSLDCLVSAGYYLDLFYPADMHYGYDPELPQAELLALEDAQRQDLRLEHVAQGIAWTDQWRRGALVDQPLHGRVLGGEACLWSELVDEATLPVRLFSRLPAVAERFWSEADVVDLASMYERLGEVLEHPPLSVREIQHGHLARLGLDDEQIVLAGLLEPVKWYARLLGEQALQARLSGSEMPQARPYDADTPLNRVIDFIAPESLPARAVEHINDQALRHEADGWSDLNPVQWPDDMKSVIRDFAALGRLIIGHLDGEVNVDDYHEHLRALYQPRGEYMLAVIPHLLRRAKPPGRS